MQEEAVARAKGEEKSNDAIEEEESNQDDYDEEAKQDDNDKKKKKKKRAKSGPGANNLDLLREAGVGGGYGFMNDYFVGGNSSAKGNAKLSMIGGGGGFTHLNTIEEEKHET